jgi:hypothetical protein
MNRIGALALALALLPAAVAAPAAAQGKPKDPNTAEVQAVDRFSDAAGMLFRRSADPTLPQANQPINLDAAPFITFGLGPNGERVAYYNFDVMSLQPAPIFVLVGADGMPVAGQLNLIDVVPGEPGYNDFWRVTMVQVPASYQANEITNVTDLTARLADANSGFTATSTEIVVNCPVVPAGSRAARKLSGGPSALARGWYRDRVVHYFSFEEDLMAVEGRVPVSPIFVMFANNMDPSGGFSSEPASSMTHNVLATLPGQAGYSPLWSVTVLDNSAFNDVRDLASAQNAAVLMPNIALVNCPVVSVTAAPAAQQN